MSHPPYLITTACFVSISPLQSFSLLFGIRTLVLLIKHDSTLEKVFVNLYALVLCVREAQESFHPSVK